MRERAASPTTPVNNSISQLKQSVPRPATMLTAITTSQTRYSAKVQLPIKVQGKWFYYILDTKNGTFPNPELFDFTAGMKRTLNQQRRFHYIDHLTCLRVTMPHSHHGEICSQSKEVRDNKKDFIIVKLIKTMQTSEYSPLQIFHVFFEEEEVRSVLASSQSWQRWHALMPRLANAKGAPPTL
ncbi:hypothetical protein J6590_015312 [Homalodisca vitripennis]|nr:hypothetical protein J6590_015312 [Homalodisca vitripennis]